MKLDHLTEAKNTPVILVDFQPSYDHGDRRYVEAMKNVVAYLNKNNPDKNLIFFNGTDIGVQDNKHDVLQHYIEYGLKETVAGNLNFREKMYAFFRSWMDAGMDEHSIIQVIRYLVTNNLHQSDEIKESKLKELIGEKQYDQHESIIYSDPIWIPGISIGELKAFSGMLLGGGQESECLREIQLLMNAFNIRYKQVTEWIY